MGVTVTGRDYANRYRPEIVDFLLGNTGDWQELTLVCRFAVEKEFTNGSPLNIRGNKMIISDGSDWSSYGFDLGDSITYSFQLTMYDSSGNVQSGFPTTLTGTRNITAIGGNEITLDGASLGNLDMPSNTGRQKIDNVIVYSDKKPEGAIITYGHIENADFAGSDLSSFIDGTDTQFSARNMHTLTGWQPLTVIGNHSGMSVKVGNWNYWDKVGTHSYQYAFNIEFMLSSFLEDLTNLISNTAPSQVFNASSLTDNFKIVGYPEWNNPNTRIQSDLQKTKRLGNTGWFDENFNGLTDNFTISGLVYKDTATGTVLNRLSYTQETDIECRISGIANLANGLTQLGIGFAWFPEDDTYYKNKPTPFHENTLINTAGYYGSGVFVPTNFAGTTTYLGFGTTPMNVKNVHFEIQGADLVYKATFSPSVAFTNFMNSIDEADRNYLLWVSVADRLEVTNFSDRVSKRIDFNVLDDYIAPVGAFSPMKIEFKNHVGNKVCSNMYVEDDILAEVSLNVDITDVIPTAITHQIEAENIATGEKVELESYKIDLSGFPNDASGVPQWNFNQSRGFKYVAGNDKNWVKVQREPANDTASDYGYLAHYGFKIRWEDWIQRLGIPSAFFDATELNNGFHNDWYHYLSTAGWKINYTVYTDAVLGGIAVRYENERELVFNDYDSNADVNTTWFSYRDSDNYALNAGLDATTGKQLATFLTNEKIRIEVFHTKLTGNWGALADIYGTICIEVDRGAGVPEFRQLSTEVGSESDNPLIPLTGETHTKKTLVSPNVVKLECLVDTSKLLTANRYKITSKIDCK